MKLLVVDDHAVVRQGVKQILLDEFDKVFVGEASNTHEMFDQLEKRQWDVVMLDIGLPGRSGLDALREVTQRCPKLPVLILSARPEDQLAVRLIKAGASGYITKETAPDELVNAIRKVLAGRKYVSPTLAETLALSIGETFAQMPHESLSDREFQVMCLLAGGKSLREIADELMLSVSTVSTHRAKIFQKLHIKTKSELVRYAVQYRLIQ